MSDAAFWRNFCMKEPRPDVVRVVTADETQDLVVKDFENWARLGESVDALDPDQVLCFDENEKLLRAQKRKVAKLPGGVQIPSALHSDPETARLTHFANLLHRAYEHSTEISFNRLADLLQVISERETSASVRVAQLEAENRELDSQNAEMAAVMKAGGVAAEGGAPPDIMSAFMSSFLQGQSDRKKAPKPSGEVS